MTPRFRNCFFKKKHPQKSEVFSLLPHKKPPPTATLRFFFRWTAPVGGFSALSGARRPPWRPPGGASFADEVGACAVGKSEKDSFWFPFGFLLVSFWFPVGAVGFLFFFVLRVENMLVMFRWWVSVVLRLWRDLMLVKCCSVVLLWGCCLIG